MYGLILNVDLIISLLKLQNRSDFIIKLHLFITVYPVRDKTQTYGGFF